MRVFFATVFFVLFSAIVVAQEQRNFTVPKLSSQAQASLLTVGLGDDIYQLFGHTAIRIKDQQLGWDLVYNYGTFDFYDPDFLKKFVKGELMYYLSVDNYGNFINSYKEENRSVQEQVINLDSTQVQKLFDFLTINAREENKYYKYDFLYDNCSTRPRDVFTKVIYKNQLKFQADKDDSLSYRKLIRRHNTNKWLGFGMDLLIGKNTDKKAGYGRTFLPYELEQLFDGATLNGQPIVNSSTEILAQIPYHKPKQWFTPLLFFWILFVTIFLLQIKGWLNDTFYKIFAVTFFLVLGAIGWLLIYLWFGTIHTTTKWNLNLLWAFPLNLPLAFLLLKKPKRWMRNYFFYYRLVLILLLGAWVINPQKYNFAVIPIIFLSILLISKYLPVPTSKEL